MLLSIASVNYSSKIFPPHNIYDYLHTNKFAVIAIPVAELRLCNYKGRPCNINTESILFTLKNYNLNHYKSIRSTHPIYALVDYVSGSLDGIPVFLAGKRTRLMRYVLC